MINPLRNSPTRLDRVLRVSSVIGLLALADWCCPPARAQQSWDYSPYRILVWLVLEDSPEFPAGLYEQLTQTLAERADVVAGSAWDLQARRCPPELRAVTLWNLAGLTVDGVKQVEAKQLTDNDKLILLRVQAGMSEFLVQARELDCATRTWSPVVARSAVPVEQIPETCFAAVRAAFTPLGRIETTSSGDVRVRVRAGGLILQESNVAQIHDTDVLLPVFRRDDRQGEPLPSGIQTPPWTFLTVAGREGHVLTCNVRSGIRLSFDTPSAARARKYARVVKPPLDSTVLCVQSQGKTPQPLAGYEVSARDPDTEAVTVIGKTDWRGQIQVPKADKPLRVVYVRNAGQLLARLPMVPGWEAELTAKVINDDPRLLAEGYLKGLQNHVMDLVATRQLCMVRFRRLLAKKDFEQARRLLEEFRRLETRTDLTRQLDQQEQRLACPDRRVQAKIDKLFSDTRQLLSKFLDPYTANSLAQELAQAERGQSPAPTPDPATPSS